MSDLTPVQRVCQRIDALFILYGWDRVVVNDRLGCTHYEHTKGTGLTAVLNPLRFSVWFNSGGKEMPYLLAKSQAEVEQFIETGDRPLTQPVVMNLFTSDEQGRALAAHVNRDYEIDLVWMVRDGSTEHVKLTVEELRAIRQEITGVIIYIEESQRLEP